MDTHDKTMAETLQVEIKKTCHCGHVPAWK
jgi:hypothetical protein